MVEIKNSNNFDKLFAEYLDEQRQLSSSSVSGNNYRYYSSSSFTVYFYEWSDITNRPRQFGSREIFLKFLSDCNISLTEYQLNRINSGYWFYGSCKPGKSELLLCDNYSTLRDCLIAYK